ncbi:MAG: SDR family NAD(P)-dependent oxidoreductase [Ardenticatenaceae bacterium]|nr:SDR family NAD(P)-dependent oxidoreductase [Ardenticatenaceae bacterium]
MFDFTDQVVMITGAAGNLGHATALAFRRGGARLALANRSYNRLEETFADLSTAGDVLFLAGDLTDPGAVEGLARETIEAFGRIDVLVNVAGGFKMGTPVHETPLETWDAMLDLNARTVIYTGRAVIPYMLQQHSGKIINVAARAALAGKANMGAYIAAKSVVVRLTETMAAELASQGINVNCVLPGTIDTPQNRRAMPQANFSNWVAPEALADVICFLASPAARAIHGASVPVYGLS